MGLPFTVASVSAANAAGVKDNIATVIKVWVNFMQDSSCG
jgi:hypothetical protein